MPQSRPVAALTLSALALSLAALPRGPHATAAPATAAQPAVQPVAPYLQQVTPTSAIVMWRTAQPEASVVRAEGREYGETTPVTHHRVEILGLRPDARVAYEVPGIGQGVFRTPPLESGKARFAIVGDTGSGNANQRAVAARMTEYRPDFLLHMGDVVYDDGEERLFPQRFFAPFAKLIANAPLYPVLGNHDVRSERGAAYLRAFEPPAAESGTERYYSFRWGQAEFFALDTTDRDFLKAGSPQAVWLERALWRSKATWKIAFGHHPIFSNGADGGKPFLRERALPLFQRYGVDWYLSGHEHDYERFEAPEGGVRFLVTGGGGAWLRPGRNKDKDRDKPSVYRDAYHFVGAELDGRRLTFTAIDKDGRAFDAVTLEK